MAESSLLPPRPVRDTRLDLVRGWLQLSIFLSHAQGSFAGAWLIHGSWGLSDSSEQFVFLSGLTLGSVFVRKQLRDGWRPASGDMLRRAARLWRTHLVTLALFGATVLAVDQAGRHGEAVSYGWGFLVHDPLRAVPAALAMLYQPAYLDALSVFVWSMLLLPGFLWLVRRAGAWALLAPGGLWLAVQMLHLPAPDLSPDTPPAFNVLAWQAPFLLGAFLGRQRLLLGRAVSAPAWVLAGAGVVVLAGLALRLQEHGLIPLGLSMPGWAWTDKEALGPARLLHALALALLVGWALPPEARWMHMGLLPLLAAAGRHSLQVFCFGLFLSYGVSVAFRVAPASTPWLDPLLTLAGIAALLLFARMLDRGRPAPRPQPAEGPA